MGKARAKTKAKTPAKAKARATATVKRVGQAAKLVGKKAKPGKATAKRVGKATAKGAARKKAIAKRRSKSAVPEVVLDGLSGPMGNEYTNVLSTDVTDGLSAPIGNEYSVPSADDSNASTGTHGAADEGTTKSRAKTAAKRRVKAAVGVAKGLLGGEGLVTAAKGAAVDAASDAAGDVVNDVMPKVKAAIATRSNNPESPLDVIDTATHAALVAINPIPSSPRDFRPSRHPRTKSTPPFLATIAPRNVFLPDRVIVDVEGDTFPRTKLDEHGRDESILSATVLDAIRVKASVAQRYVETGDYKIAYDAFLEGFELVPAPFENWNAAGWLLVAMGECATNAGDHARAFAALRDAMHCPGTVGNPWVHLRLGQVRLELADERAADDLSRAYTGGGRSLFDGLDPKYLAVVEKT